MPTYDFRCPKGHEFSRFYKTMSTALSQLPCVECGAVAERQLSASAGFAFKGSGFYLTDYGKNAHRGTDPSASKGAATTSGGDKTSESPATTAAPAKSETSAKSESTGKAESPKPKAESPKPKAESPKPKAE